MNNNDERDYAEEAYNRDFCGACGSSPCDWDGQPDGFHTDEDGTFSLDDCLAGRTDPHQCDCTAMFDTLTPAERQALRVKLAEWAHRAAEVGHVLANVALAASPITDPIVWDQAERHYAVMDELYDLRAELAA